MFPVGPVFGEPGQRAPITQANGRKSEETRSANRIGSSPLARAPDVARPCNGAATNRGAAVHEVAVSPRRGPGLVGYVA
jgi:hypothetical protein